MRAGCVRESSSPERPHRCNWSRMLRTWDGEHPWAASERKVRGCQGEVPLHINIKELQVVRLAYRAFLPHLQNRVVAVLTDNSTAMYYINKQGGVRSSPLCWELWEMCVAHGICLEASHLPGTRNGLADRLSCSIQAHKWVLRRDILHKVFQRWRFPCLDLFATLSNAKCWEYYWYMGHGLGSRGDALQIRWPRGLLYAFPLIHAHQSAAVRGPGHSDSAGVASPTLVHHPVRPNRGETTQATSRARLKHAELRG